jgi:hypothetical protein
MSRLRLSLSLPAVSALVVVLALGRADSQQAVPIPAVTIPSPLLGITFGASEKAYLERLDPLTLRRVSKRRLELRGHFYGYSFSSDRSRLVLGNDHGELHLVDARGLRLVADVPTGLDGGVLATQWLGPDELVAVVAAESGSTILWLAVNERRVVAKRAIEGSVQALAHAPNALVLVLGPRAGIGPSRLVRVRAGGDVGEASVERIRSGWDGPADEGENSPPAVHHYVAPGVAVDPAGTRAVVVSAGSPVAEVDLSTLAVRWHELTQPTPLLRRLDAFLEPPAQAKGPVEGSSRGATWLGAGVFAVSGYDSRAYVDASGRLQGTSRPAGVDLVDTADWTVRTLDPQAGYLTVARGGLLTMGSTYDSGRQQSVGTGLTIYGPDGAVRAHLFGSSDMYAVTVGGRAFVPVPSYGYRIVGVASGTVLRTIRDRNLPGVLVDQASPY